MSNMEIVPDFIINQRIEDLINHLKKKPSSFAASVNKSGTVINQILARRNKPSYDLLEAILLAYPQVNANWLMRGQGDMIQGKEDESLVKPKIDNYMLHYVAELEGTVKDLRETVKSQAEIIRVMNENLGKH